MIFINQAQLGLVLYQNKKEMKKRIYILLGCFGLLFCNAQNYNNDKVTLEQEKLLFIDYTATENTENTAKTSNYKNIILVNQQGSSNFSDVKIKAKNSDVEIQQIGDKNSVTINVEAEKVQEKILQIGDGNVFRDYNHLNMDYHGVNILQEGNNQNIYMNGNNSIIQKLKITQTGNNKTIYINNY
jgi:minor curlin subunit